MADGKIDCLAATSTKMDKGIHTLNSTKNHLSWINIISAQKKEIDYLKRKYKFDDLDLKDSFTDNYAQRPKFYARSDYFFLILQYPIFNKNTRTIEAEEVDFFISKNFIATLHKNNLSPLVELYNLCESDTFYREQYFTSPSSLLYEIISNLQEYCYPLLDHISLDIKNIEHNIFAGRERQMVTEILHVKRKILSFRKIMQAHKNVIQKMMRENIQEACLDNNRLILGQVVKNKRIPSRNDKSKMFFSDLIERTKEIWDNLGEQKEMIEALEDTNTSLVSFKLSDIMRVLTIFSVIVFPLTLLAAIFGMNTTVSMPFIEHPYGFWIIMILMFIGAMIMYAFFKLKKWL